MPIMRAIMILENVKHHPLFSQFVRFVQSGDKYRLGADWPGGIDAIVRNSSVLDRARGAGIVPEYNQERRPSGITHFKTYQLIKEG